MAKDGPHVHFDATTTAAYERVVSCYSTTSAAFLSIAASPRLEPFSALKLNFSILSAHQQRLELLETKCIHSIHLLSSPDVPGPTWPWNRRGSNTSTHSYSLTHMHVHAHPHTHLVHPLHSCSLSLGCRGRPRPRPCAWPSGSGHA